MLYICYSFLLQYVRRQAPYLRSTANLLRFKLGKVFAGEVRMLEAASQALLGAVTVLVAQFVTPISHPATPIACGHCECSPVCGPSDVVNQGLIELLRGQLDRCGPANLTVGKCPPTAPCAPCLLWVGIALGVTVGILCGVFGGSAVRRCCGFCWSAPSPASATGERRALTEGAPPTVPPTKAPPQWYIDELAAKSPPAKVATPSSRRSSSTA